jgi:hypothetical protein
MQQLEKKTDMRKRGRLWWIAFIAGTIFYGFLTFYLLFVTMYMVTPDNVIGLVGVMIVLGTIMLAIKLVIVSGVMLVVESVCLIIWGAFLSKNPDIIAALIINLPGIIGGVLFLLSGFKYRAREKDVKPY